MPPPAATLVVERVSFSFGTRKVLDGMSLVAAPGRVTCLLGPSGCGKTSLLRILAGIEQPQAGRILLDGAEVAGPGGFVPPERRRVGLMFQDYALFPHLSVRDNVLFGLGDRSRAAAREAADEALARVGMSRLAAMSPGQLSGGEQQRVALARAIAPSPRILLMDEPFSNLDRGLRERVREETITLLARSGITTVMVTHDPDEALAVGDHLALLADGRVLQNGSGEDIYRRPNSLAAARALSDLNEVPGQLSKGRLLTPLGSFETALTGPDGTTALLCVRPEGLRAAPTGSGVSGRVVKRVFRGALDVLFVAVPDLDPPLRVMAAQTTAVPGDAVRLSVDPGRAFMFDA